MSDINKSRKYYLSTEERLPSIRFGMNTEHILFPPLSPLCFCPVNDGWIVALLAGTNLGNKRISFFSSITYCFPVNIAAFLFTEILAHFPSLKNDSVVPLNDFLLEYFKKHSPQSSQILFQYQRYSLIKNLPVWE